MYVSHETMIVLLRIVIENRYIMELAAFHETILFIAITMFYSHNLGLVICCQKELTQSEVSV